MMGPFLFGADRLGGGPFGKDIYPAVRNTNGLFGIFFGVWQRDGENLDSTSLAQPNAARATSWLHI